MANQSKLIRSTVRDPVQEQARLERMTITAHENYKAFVAEMIEYTGEATGLASSRWAIGEQKNYKIAPGGPRNLDLCDNSIARGPLVASSSKMNDAPNDALDSQLAKLGGLQNSRFSQSSSRECIFQAGANIFTPTKANSRTSSLSGSAKSFTPTSLASSPSSGGGVSLVSSPTGTFKDVAAKKVDYQQQWEQMLFADMQRRMSKFEAVTSTEANTADNQNVSVASQEPLAAYKANSIIKENSIAKEKFIDMPVVTKAVASAISDTNLLSSKATSTTPFIMKENEFMAMLVKAQAEKDAKKTPLSATSTSTASVSAHSIASATAPVVAPIAGPVVSSVSAASVIASASAVSQDAIVKGSEKRLSSAFTKSVIAGPSMMKENEFMAMLMKEQQEKDLKREAIVTSAPTIKKEDFKVNIQQAKSDLSCPQTQIFNQESAISKTNNTVERKSELLIKEKLIFATRANNPNTTRMSNKPLISAPINKWTTSKLTQGKSLSKADEDFQTFLANKTAATAAAAAARTQQTVIKPLSPKRTPTKQTKAEVDAEKRKLAAGQADFAALLTRRFADTPTSPPTKEPINKAITQGVALNVEAKIFTMPEAYIKDGQAILAELKAASKDFVTNTPITKKENVINTNPKVINASNTVNNKLASTVGNLAVFKGESSQDKISHVAVHSFTPNEKERVIHSNTQINNPFNDKLLKKKKQAGSLVSSAPFWSISSVSDIDIGDKMDNTIVDPKFKEGVRVTATQDANIILADWDGSWCAPPIWEERGTFDANYVPSYIKEWSAVVSPVLPVNITVDTSAEGFVSGEDLVNNVILSKAPKHEPTFPDILNSSNEKKRLNQTAGQEAAAYLKKAEKAQKAQEYRDTASHAYQQELFVTMEPEPNPFAPKIETYLRPATETDAKQILQIYNHYITESYIPEDQEPLTESDILFIIEVTKQQKLPFVVAVKGRVPAQSANSKIKTKVPQYENVIGFGYTEMRGCGIAGKSTGRSRYTHNMHFYVHQDYSRKGVGSCVLDRLLKVSSRAWSGHDGYDWLDPNNDPSYGHGCGARCHQILIEVPVLRKNDPNYEWMKNFLRKFWFMEEFRLRCVGRTSVAQRAGEWLDIVHFQKELEHEAEFTPFV